MEKLKPSFHEHPLTFIEELEDDGVYCKECILSISGPCYKCDICECFLHKSCAELPLEMTHPLHPHHRLKIDYDDNLLKCFSCKSPFQGFCYRCGDCDFLLDVFCGHTSMWKLQQRIQHRTHNISIYISKPVMFSCDACGVEHRGKSYLCTTCKIMVNKTCYASPKCFKHDNHRHDLILTDCLPYEDFKFLHQCEICHEALFLNREYWTYYCKDCRYFVHLKCAKSKAQLSSDVEQQIDEANLITLPLPDESIHPLTLFMKKMSGEGNYQRATEINHPSHMHPLIFSRDRSKALVGQCNGCALPILAPFYHCAKIECNFFLHEWCAELPNQLQHLSHHEHALELNTDVYIRAAMCSMCKEDGNIFRYTCSTCEYKIDCKCASLTSIIKHEAHGHALVLQESGKDCSLCAKFQWLGFACESCSFIMCLDCAFLPRLMRHRYDVHPFRLTYSPADLGADEFYCEICEKEIDPNLCFYHCVVCDQSIHPNCILPRLPSPNWKFGTTLKVKVHPHILTFVEEAKRGSGCGKCGKTRGSAVYKCKTCGFWLHSSCLKGENYLS